MAKLTLLSTNLDNYVKDYTLVKVSIDIFWQFNSTANFVTIFFLCDGEVNYYYKWLAYLKLVYKWSAGRKIVSNDVFKNTHKMISVQIAIYNFIEETSIFNVFETREK